MEDDLNFKVNGRQPQFTSPSFSWAWHSSASTCFLFSSHFFVIWWHPLPWHLIPLCAWKAKPFHWDNVEAMNIREGQGHVKPKLPYHCALSWVYCRGVKIKVIDLYTDRQHTKWQLLYVKDRRLQTPYYKYECQTKPTTESNLVWPLR